MAVPFITPYVLESPWALAGVLAVLGVIACWSAVKTDRRGLLKAGLVMLALGVVAVAAGQLVVTPGERASEVTHKLIQAAVAEDLSAVDQQLAERVVLSLGAEGNAGISKEAILNLVENRLQEAAIQSNSIRGETIESVDGRSGWVRLTCSTIVEGFPYPTLSKWKVWVEREVDGRWRVKKIVCERINNQAPSSLEF